MTVKAARKSVLIGYCDQLMPGAEHIGEHFVFVQVKASIHRCSSQGTIKIHTLHDPEIIILVKAIDLFPKPDLQIRYKQGWNVEVNA
jgi:hypothetical protein